MLFIKKSRGRKIGKSLKINHSSLFEMASLPQSQSLNRLRRHYNLPRSLVHPFTITSSSQQSEQPPHQNSHTSQQHHAVIPDNTLCSKRYSKKSLSLFFSVAFAVYGVPMMGWPGSWGFGITGYRDIVLRNFHVRFGGSRHKRKNNWVKKLLGVYSFYNIYFYEAIWLCEVFDLLVEQLITYSPSPKKYLPLPAQQCINTCNSLWKDR